MDEAEREALVFFCFTASAGFLLFVFAVHSAQGESLLDDRALNLDLVRVLRL